MDSKYHARGGKADIRNRTWRSAAWKKVRRIVLERDGYTCQRCGRAATTVHHKNPVIEEIGNPFDPNECESLCHPCHGIMDGYRSHTTRGGIRNFSTSAYPPLTQLRKNVKVGEPRGNRFLQTVGGKHENRTTSETD